MEAAPQPALEEIPHRGRPAKNPAVVNRLPLVCCQLVRASGKRHHNKEAAAEAVAAPLTRYQLATISVSCARDLPVQADALSISADSASKP
jgi:hypothetical protein